MLTIEVETEIAKVCSELQALQRERSVYIKSRIMQANRLQAIVAGCLGYSSGMEEKDRKRKFAEAGAVITQVLDGHAEPPFASIIRISSVGIDGFVDAEKRIEKAMVKLARQLPVAEWVNQPEQKGFGMQSLATIVGECGNLSNYANPAKVWRRMGCAPREFNGHTLMGATWRSKKYGILPAEEWAGYGYSPRRRSIAYMIGEALLKQNRNIRVGEGSLESDLTSSGPYLLRYEQAKSRMAEAHEGDELYPPQRCHRHGMLCATKLLLKNLWIEWRRMST